MKSPETGFAARRLQAASRAFLEKRRSSMSATPDHDRAAARPPARLQGGAAPMTNVDAAWLHMERPTNLMMVCGVMTFATPLDRDHLRAVLEHRLLEFDRFRQRVEQGRAGSARWVPAEDFRLEDHLVVDRLPEPGDQEALQTYCSQKLSEPLDFDKPLWQVHLLEGYQGGEALLTRIHHCIADGVALVRVLLSLTEAQADAPVPEPLAEADQGQEPEERRRRTALTTARKLTRRFMRGGLEGLGDRDRWRKLARLGVEAPAAAGRLALRGRDPQTAFKGELGEHKRAAWTRALPLDQVKELKNRLGGTVNDVLITAMCGALRRYLLARGDDVDRLDVGATIPVNLRRAHQMGELGNKFGLVFLDLPVGIADAGKRLRVVRKRMDRLKRSPEAPMILGLMAAVGGTPVEIQKRLVDFLSTKATLVMTNVPGPTVPLYLAGSEIDGIMFWVPQSGGIGVGVSILSYSGKVFMGLATDAALVPDPQALVDAFYEEFDEMCRLAALAAGRKALSHEGDSP